MRRSLLVLLFTGAALHAVPARVAAQDTLPPRADTSRTSVLPTRPPERDRVRLALPPEIVAEVVELYNAPGTLRVSGSFEVPADREVRGDVAVLNGPVTVAGRLGGRLLAVNADVSFAPGGRVDGDVLVVGGTLTGRADAEVSGDVRVYGDALGYRMDGERLVAVIDDDRGWTARWRNRRVRAYSGLRIVSARTYNRVEGLPILVGPRVRRDVGWARFTLEALGIVRTAENFRWDSDNLGHSVRGELRLGSGPGIKLGGHLFDVVGAVEEWQLSPQETGLAAFFLQRDYRDYFNRHGGSLSLSAVAGDNADLTLTVGQERWGSRADRDPFTLIRQGGVWRDNPSMDEGLFRIADLALRYDTRNDDADPWSGWYVQADVERGRGRLDALGARSLSPAAEPVGAVGQVVNYTRGFLDVRRYNRLAPNAQLNMRLVSGGWLGGDELPLQRRFSVGGPATLPGFDFRRVRDGREDLGQCGAAPELAAPGRPAECERMVLVQLEYLGDIDIHLGVFDDEDEEEDSGEQMRRSRRRYRFSHDAQWVIFTDAGRGWLVGSRVADLRYPAADIPPLSSFRTDVGAGVQLGSVGLYVAKAVSDAREPANFFIRVRRRF